MDKESKMIEIKDVLSTFLLSDAEYIDFIETAIEESIESMIISNFITGTTVAKISKEDMDYLKSEYVLFKEIYNDTNIIHELPAFPVLHRFEKDML